MHIHDVVPERIEGHAHCYRHHLATVSGFDPQEFADAVEEEDWDCVGVLVWAVVRHVLDCTKYHLWEEET